MYRLIVAGVPAPVFKRNKAYRPVIEDWSVEIVPSRHERKGDLDTCWAEVLKLASRAGSNGAHIAAYHFIDDERPRFWRSLGDRHRLVWLSGNDVTAFGRPEFTDTLDRIARFEEEWRDALRPSSVNHPLILPEPSFESRGRYGEVWRRARRTQIGRDDLMQLAGLLTGFRQEHWIERVWQDTRDILFNPGGPRHGQAASGNEWKFTFRVPSGFHFDVSHRRRAGFSLVDVEGVRRSFKTYTNVDCHGIVRGGK